MTEGKLYRLENDKLIIIGEIEYKFQSKATVGWWGELVFTEFRKAADGDSYVLETGDGRMGKCAIKKKVNKAVHGIPPLYYYHVRGTSPLE